MLRLQLHQPTVRHYKWSRTCHWFFFTQNDVQTFKRFIIITIASSLVHHKLLPASREPTLTVSQSSHRFFPISCNRMTDWVVLEHNDANGVFIEIEFLKCSYVLIIQTRKLRFIHATRNDCTVCKSWHCLISPNVVAVSWQVSICD